MNQLIQYFQPTEHLSLLGFIIRTIVSMVFIYFMTRFLMKRAAGQFTSFDFVFLWMLGALAVAPLLDGKIEFSTTILATASLYFWHFIISFIRVKSRFLALILSGKPIILMDKGIIIEKNMRRTFFNNELLLSELRLIHCYDLNELEQVTLELNGHLSIVKKSHYSVPTAKDFQIPVQPSTLPTILINRGEVLYKNLMLLDLTENWLIKEFQKYGIDDLSNIYLATINSNGKIYYSTMVIPS
ncbi:DUF421 domain-containing protein [Vallitalea maricola]|uniref:Uncharacterized protein n=1 Tax=Vallitalea maricola TaxID=3074433 RepID=A0ACB5UQF3_9FIRM|nr:hypothetical protein AN2V17_40920 [Vallitalea sp. AN17-2]